MWSIQNGNSFHGSYFVDYNILNIVVNTELVSTRPNQYYYYNILNIVVNTEPTVRRQGGNWNYNILNIVVNTEHFYLQIM